MKAQKIWIAYLDPHSFEVTFEDPRGETSILYDGDRDEDNYVEYKEYALIELGDFE